MAVAALCVYSVAPVSYSHPIFDIMCLSMYTTVVGGNM